MNQRVRHNVPGTNLHRNHRLRNPEPTHKRQGNLSQLLQNYNNIKDDVILQIYLKPTRN